MENYVQENREIIEEEGPVEYNPDKRDFRKVRYVEADVGYPGMRLAVRTDSPKYVSSENYEELLDAFDQQKKELDKSIRNEANLIERLSLKGIALDQLKEKHDILCEAYETQEEENLEGGLKRLESERDAKYTDEDIYWKGYNDHREKYEDVKVFTIEQIEEAFEDVPVDEVSWEVMKENLTKQKKRRVVICPKCNIEMKRHRRGWGCPECAYFLRD